MERNIETPHPSSVPNKDSPPDANTFRILVATDNHLGYMEKDNVRGMDAFNTFEEILQLAHHYQADFLLLSGDLFHENSPSMPCFHRSIKLLRQYCLNDRPVSFQLISDPKTNFKGSHFDHANYEDHHLNVGLPVFTIHGNHDDPLGPGSTCALDLLHDAGLVNLFGRYHSVEEVNISPILLRKGDTKLALYGLGAVRDSRLNRLFITKNVTFLRPEESADDWFSVLAFHQNRSPHGGRKNYIPESFLDEFLDLVIWGHEHECRLDPEWNTSQQFYVSQPGSSVATSLSEGESVEKYVGLLEICGKEFHMHKLRLQTVRPFLMESLVLDEIDSLTSCLKSGDDLERRVQTFCAEKIENMLQRLQMNSDSRQSQRAMLPLIRLRVDYSGGFETFSSLRFGQKFVEKVANPNDLISFHRRKEQHSATRGLGGGLHLSQVKLENAKLNTRQALETCVESLVKDILSQTADKMQLMLLPEKDLTHGVQACVNKNSNEAIDDVVKLNIGNAKDHLHKKNVAVDTDAVREICRLKVIRERLEKEVAQENTEGEERTKVKIEPNEEEEIDDNRLAAQVANFMNLRGNNPLIPIEDEPESFLNTPNDISPVKRGRGRGRGGATSKRGGTGRGRGKSATSGQRTLEMSYGSSKKQTFNVQSDDDENGIEISDGEEDNSDNRSVSSSLFSKSAASKSSHSVFSTNLSKNSQSSRKRPAQNTQARGANVSDDDDEFSFDFRRNKRGK